MTSYNSTIGPRSSLEPGLDVHGVRVYTSEQLEFIAQNPMAKPDVFVDINTPVIDYLNDMFHTSSIIQTVFELAVSALLESGIVFQRSGKFVSSRENRVLQYPWVQFCRMLVASLYTFGVAFCVLEDHKDLIKIPHVLDLTQVHIRVHTNPYGHRYYAVFARTSQTNMFMSKLLGSHTGQLMDGELVKGVFVFEDLPWVPTKEGCLRSRLLSLTQDIVDYHKITFYNLEAIRLSTMPYVFTEQVENAKDHNNVQYTSLIPEESLGGVARADDVPRIIQLPSAVLARDIAGDTRLNTINNTLAAHGAHPGAPPSGDNGGYASSVASFSGPSQRGFGIVDLVTQRRPSMLVTSKHMQDYGDYAARVEERIGSVFGVPRSLFSQSSRGKTGSNDALNDETFKTHRHALKQKITPFLMTMFHAIYGVGDDDEEDDFTESDDEGRNRDKSSGASSSNSLIEYDPVSRRENKKRYWTRKHLSGIAEASNESPFSIDPNNTRSTDKTMNAVYLPSVPPHEQLDQLYLQGVLAYDAYVHMVSVDTGMPRDWFNEVAAISLQEANGIKEQQGSSTTKTESKTTNAKTKAGTSKGVTQTNTSKPQTGVGSKYDIAQSKKNNKKRKLFS